MRVLYDNGGIESRCGGVSRYYAELLRRLPDLGCDYILPFSGSVSQYFQEAPYNLAKREDEYGSFISRREFRGKYRLWQIARRICPRHFRDYAEEDRAVFCAALDEGDFDLLHLTAPHRCGSDWKRVAGKKPIVVTIHDLVPELFQDSFSSTYVSAVKRERTEVLSVASRIIAVSENTKRDLVRLYGVPEAKIRVVYHGCGMIGETSSGYKKDAAPIILFVGRKEGYKNFAWFRTAIQPLLHEGWKLQCSDGQLSETELATAYRSATAFVYPSLYEGFGLPILEAWANRCPVVCTNAGSFPEIAENASLYFEPGDAEGLRRNIRALKEDPSLRSRQIDCGSKRLTRFSWERCASETSSVYRGCVEEA